MTPSVYSNIEYKHPLYKLYFEEKQIDTEIKLDQLWKIDPHQLKSGKPLKTIQKRQNSTNPHFVRKSFLKICFEENTTNTDIKYDRIRSKFPSNN